MKQKGTILSSSRFLDALHLRRMVFASRTGPYLSKHLTLDQNLTTYHVALRA